MFNTASIIGHEIPKGDLSETEALKIAEAAHAEYERLAGLSDEELTAKMRELVIKKFDRDAYKMGAMQMMLQINLLLGMHCEHTERVDRFILDALQWRINSTHAN